MQYVLWRSVGQIIRRGGSHESIKTRNRLHFRVAVVTMQHVPRSAATFFIELFHIVCGIKFRCWRCFPMHVELPAKITACFHGSRVQITDKVCRAVKTCAIV